MSKKISQLSLATDVTAADLLQVVDIEDGAMAQSGTNKKVTANILAQDLGKLMSVTATGSTQSRKITDRFADVVNVKDFGAVGDGSTDDTAAFTSALAASRSILVPAGTYRLTSTITLNQFGHSIIGIGGKNTTILSIDHVTGPGVTIAQGQCVLENLTIRASDTRRAFTSGGTYDLASELFGVKLYNASGYMTQCRLYRIVVQRHPNHGIYMGGEGAGTQFIQCESNYNRGHGYAFDDRTIGGGSPSRCGIVSINECRALDNGGNALNLSQVGSTCYRFNVVNFETLWNAWNTSIASLQNSEIYIAGENNNIQQCAFYDANGDTRTVMGNGDSRLAKTSNLSTGIYISGSADNIFLNNNRFLSCYKGVVSGTSTNFIRISGAYFTQQVKSSGSSNVVEGFNIGNNSANLKIDVQPSSAVSTMIATNTLIDPPLVVNKKLSSTYSITGTAAWEVITGVSDSVYLPVGSYRISISATVQNGSTDGANYSIGVALTDSSASTASLVGTAYKTFMGNYYDTMAISVIHKITTADTYTVALRVRQANGNLGSVLESNSTFGNTMLQVERIL